MQLNRARLTLGVVSREEIKTRCECRGHEHAGNTKPKGASHPGGDDPMDIGALSKGKGKRLQRPARQGQRHREAMTPRTARREPGQGQEPGLNRMNKGRAKGNSQKQERNGRSQSRRNQQPVNWKLKSADLACFVPMWMLWKRELFEWIKIGFDTGPEKTAWPQSVTYVKRIPGDCGSHLLHSHWRACQVEQAIVP